MKSLTQKYRPTQLIDMVPSADLAMIQTLLDTNSLPNVLIFYGEPGLGKTTLARWLGNTVLDVTNKIAHAEITQTGHSNAIPNYIEIDFSRKENSTKDAVDRCASQIKNAGHMDIVGDQLEYVFVLDEFSQVSGGTNSKHVFSSQKQIVKVIEDMEVNNVYVIIIVNDISKLESSVMTRAIRLEFTYPSKQQCLTYLQGIAKKENKTITPLIAEDIYNSVTPPSLRGLALNLGIYLKTNKVNGSIERSDNLVSEYIGSLNNLANYRLERKQDKVKERILIKEMRNAINALIRSKSTMVPILHSLATYYQYRINANTDIANSYTSIDLVANIFKFINNYINERFSYTNPFLDMIMLSYEIIEYKVKIQSRNS